MATKGKIYQIDYEFQAEHNVAERTAQSTTIHIRCTSDKAAVKDAVRWWANRHKNVPDHFMNCLAVNVFEFDPQPLTETGGLFNTGRILLFQWKVTTGCGPGATIGTKLMDAPYSDPFNVDKLPRRMVRS